MSKMTHAIVILQRFNLKWKNHRELLAFHFYSFEICLFIKTKDLSSFFRSESAVSNDGRMVDVMHVLFDRHSV